MERGFHLSVMSSFAFVTLGLAGCATQRSALPPETAKVLSSFRSRLVSEVSSDGIGSISTAVIIDGRIAYTGSVGCADCDRNIAAAPNSIYRVGSVSKTMTGTVLGELAEAGVLALDDPVARYVPEIGELLEPGNNAQRITLRHLANHTSGLAREPDLRGAARGPIALWQDKILSAIPCTRLESAPGSGYRYSNIGYGILGLAMSRAAGEPYMELVEARLFRPLEMASTTFILSRSQEDLLAKGYDNSDGGGVIDTEKPAREHSGRGYKVPNGGIYSSVGDLARYVIALMGRSDDFSDLLPTSVYRRPRGITNDDGRGLEAYGLGIRMHVSASGEILSANHGGTVSGYRSWIQFDPAEGYGVVLVRNYSRGAHELSTIAEEFLTELETSLK